MKFHLVEQSTEERPFTIFEEGEEACRGPARPRPAPAAMVKPDSTGPRRKLSDVSLRVSGARHVESLVTPADSVFDPRLVETSSPAVTSNVTVQISEAVERDLLQALSGAPRAGETIEMAFRRKEEQIVAIFGALSVLEARALHRRLTTASANDLVASHFSRLVESRRARLLAFLLDTRRRQAVTRARR